MRDDQDNPWVSASVAPSFLDYFDDVLHVQAGTRRSFSAEHQRTPQEIAKLNEYYGLDKPLW